MGRSCSPPVAGGARQLPPQSAAGKGSSEFTNGGRSHELNLRVGGCGAQPERDEAHSGMHIDGCRTSARWARPTFRPGSPRRAC